MFAFACTYWPWILGILMIAALLYLAAKPPMPPKGSSHTTPLNKDWLAKLAEKEDKK
mgnify:FL=1